MKTFCVQTLGCKVNHYESEQVATVLRSFGLVESDVAHADLRVVNSCSVTVEAAAKSRQAARRMVRLPVLAPTHCAPNALPPGAAGHPAAALFRFPPDATHAQRSLESPVTPAVPSDATATVLRTPRHPRVVVMGCWATSDRDSAARLPGVDAVITHHHDVSAELDRLLTLWREEERGGRQSDLRFPDPTASQPTASDPDAAVDLRAGDTSRPQRLERRAPADSPIEPIGPLVEPPPERLRNDGWINRAGLPADSRTAGSKAESAKKVNLQIYALSVDPASEIPRDRATKNSNPRHPVGHAPGATRLPLLDARQTGRQRAFLKIQDGCDAHCTYCIIPRLRPALWSKPPDDAVTEARRLVAAGHVEIVLTGVFLSAYGHDTALRRRRPTGTAVSHVTPSPDTASPDTASRDPLATLIDALCTRVPGLRRLRLSSLEPGDLTDDLLSTLRAHPQVVPHFHLPLQSGSDAVLRKMNRQYTRDDFLRMLDRVRDAFDRPALTTDVIAGFPGETAAAFADTLDVVDRAGFIHVHAFPYSPRPGTAAARWTKQFVPGPVAAERIDQLTRRADDHSLAFRQQFVGETVELLVEHDAPAQRTGEPRDAAPPIRHGRCERYFDVHFAHPTASPGDFARVRIDAVTPGRTHGTCVTIERPAGGVA